MKKLADFGSEPEMREASHLMLARMQAEANGVKNAPIRMKPLRFARYSEEEDEKIETLLRTGATYRTIGMSLGRETASIAKRISVLGLSAPNFRS